MAIEEKYGRLKRLVDAGKEKGFLLYDEINETLELLRGAGVALPWDGRR